MEGRVKMLKRAYRTFLLCLCDIEDPVNPLAEIAQAAIDMHVTLIVAFSEAECGRYLELLKVYENKAADALKPHAETDYVLRCGRALLAVACGLEAGNQQTHHLCRVAKVLTHVRAVNKTDSALMGAERLTLADIFRSTEADLSATPGLGPAKVKRLFAAFDSPFYIDHRKAELNPGTANLSDTGAQLQCSTRDAREWVATQQARVQDAEVSDEDDC
jgi:hypothetical protein